MMDKKDKRVQKQMGITDKVIADIFAKSGNLTEEEFTILKQNAQDNVLGRYVDSLRAAEKKRPLRTAIYVAQYTKSHPHITTVQNVIDYHTHYFNYYMDSMKNVEQINFEIERAKRLLFEGDLELSLKVEFDIQYYREKDLYKKPTFYSYFNYSTVDLNGNYSHHIAIPATQSRLTDDEVRIIMKHEWGHIRQGHCRIMGNDQFDSQYNNQAMDISINSGMTEEEKELLFVALRKMTDDPKACPCMDLISPRGEGGLGVDSYISPTAWVRAVNVIKAYYNKQKQESGEEEEEEEEEQPPISSDIAVGDYVYVAGTKPEVYGEVIDIDANGKATYKEFTDEEWEAIKEENR